MRAKVVMAAAVLLVSGGLLAGFGPISTANAAQSKVCDAGGKQYKTVHGGKVTIRACNNGPNEAGDCISGCDTAPDYGRSEANPDEDGRTDRRQARQTEDDKPAKPVVRDDDDSDDDAEDPPPPPVNRLAGVRGSGSVGVSVGAESTGTAGGAPAPVAPPVVPVARAVPSGDLGSYCSDEGATSRSSDQGGAVVARPMTCTGGQWRPTAVEPGPVGEILCGKPKDWWPFPSC